MKLASALPLPAITEQDDSPLILLDAREEFPCHYYAVHALAVAIEAKKRWIRVEKKGHACEYEVNQLRDYCRSKAAMVPRAIIYTRREHEAVGNWTDQGRNLWPGIDSAREREVKRHPLTQVLTTERST